MSDLKKLLGTFTALPDSMLLNVLCKYNLPQRELRVLMAVAYKTWGRQKKGSYISQREIASMTSIDTRNISKVLKAMVNKCIIITRNGAKGTYIEINRNYMTWRLPERDGLFTEAVKLSTDRKTTKKQSAVPVDGTRDAQAPSPGTALCAVSRDGIDFEESDASAPFVAIARRVLQKESIRRGDEDA